MKANSHSPLEQFSSCMEKFSWHIYHNKLSEKARDNIEKSRQTWRDITMEEKQRDIRKICASFVEKSVK